MTLFTFSLHGELFALSGESIQQVVVPEPVQGFALEADGRAARFRGRRYPVVRVPGEALGPVGQEAAVYLLVSAGGAAIFLGVEFADGLAEVPETGLLPIPGYLFDEQRPTYRGLFGLEDRMGVLLDAEALTRLGTAAGQ